jgi:hypothetical protein
VVEFILERAIDYDGSVVPGATASAKANASGEIDISLVPDVYLVRLPNGQKYPGITIESGSENLLADLLWPDSVPSNLFGTALFGTATFG